VIGTLANGVGVIIDTMKNDGGKKVFNVEQNT